MMNNEQMNAHDISPQHDFRPETDYYDTLTVKVVSSTPDRQVDDSEAVYFDLPAQGWYPGEVRQHLRDTANQAPIQNYVLKENSTELSWGASGAGLEIILQVANAIADGTIPVLVGAALDQLVMRAKARRQPEGFLNEEAAIQYAKRRISMGHGEQYDELRVIEVELDHALSAIVSISGSAGRRYECTCSQTKGGLTMTRVKKTYVD